jgi:hypothetical protein
VLTFQKYLLPLSTTQFQGPLRLQKIRRNHFVVDTSNDIAPAIEKNCTCYKSINWGGRVFDCHT